MSWKMRGLFSLLAVGLALVSCVKEEGNDDPVVNYIGVGDPVPAFTVPGPSGEVFSSALFRGKRSLLLLFGSYCPDCQQEFPLIEEVWRQVKNDPGVRLVAISRGESARAVSDYWASQGYTMPFYLDPDKSVFALFANSTIPRVYLIGPEGTVERMWVERLGISADELAAWLRQSAERESSGEVCDWTGGPV